MPATDTIADIAVVRTARAGLPVPEYRTDLPRPGESVLAIGSPLGLENTVTAGIVSGVDRQIPGSAAQGRALVDLVQVDAPISPGNSAGALLDGTGRGRAARHRTGRAGTAHRRPRIRPDHPTVTIGSITG